MNMSFLATFWRKQVRFRLLEVFVVWLLLATFAISLGVVWLSAAFRGWVTAVAFGPERGLEGFLIGATLVGMCGWLIYKMIASGNDPEIGQPDQ